MTYCILEANLATTQLSYPFQRGWIEPPEWLVLRDRVTPEQIQGEDACALVNAIDATRFLDTHSVVSDIAIVSTHHGPIAMHTASRADEIDNAVVQLGEVSATAEALARATIHHFYGIDVVDWNRTPQDADVTVVENVDALRTPADGRNEDLIRAWFILTSLALPTHVLLAPKAALERDQKNIEDIVKLIRKAASASDERRREVRRNIADDHDINRERVTEYFNDQKLRLTKAGRKGWLDLTNRVARAMDLPVGPNPDVVSFGLAEDG